MKIIPTLFFMLSFLISYPIMAGSPPQSSLLFGKVSDVKCSIVDGVSFRFSGTIDMYFMSGPELKIINPSPQFLPTNHRVDQVLKLKANNAEVRLDNSLIPVKTKESHYVYGSGCLMFGRAAEMKKKIHFYLSNLQIITVYSQLTRISSSQVVGFPAHEIGCFDARGNFGKGCH